jgi:DNA-binding NarL/FixJ family response regulator
MKNESPGPVRKARVLVADDHPLVREGLAQVINQQSDLVCCATVATHPEVLAAIVDHKPEILVLDLRLKTGDGLEFIKSLKTQHPQLAVLVLSQFDEALYAERALRAGALGYVMKEQASDEVLVAIRTALGGRIYVTPAMNAQLLHKLLTIKPCSSDPSIEHLTDRELEVLQLLGHGKSTREIAEQIRLSTKTVETYREHLKHKLKLRNAEELVYHARQWVEKNSDLPGADPPQP